MVDIERVRKRLEALKHPKKNKENKNNSVWAPPKDGTPAEIRLIEFPFGDDPFVELSFHYGIGSGPSILCPKKNEGHECPICDFASELWKSGEQSSQSLAKQLFASERYYSVMVDRADESLTPKYWGFGMRVYESLLGKLLEEDYRDMLHTQKGVDFTITVTPAKNKDSYPSSAVSPRRQSSALGDEAKCQAILEKVKTVDEAFKDFRFGKAEIEDRLSTWLKIKKSDNKEESIRGGSEEEESKSLEESSDAASDTPVDDAAMANPDIDEAFKQATADL